MAKNYVGLGDVIDHTAAANLTSGQPVALTDRIGVALVDIANGETGAVSVEGVYTLPKTTGVGTALTQGDAVYLTPGGNITGTATGNTPAGFAFAAADDDADTVQVKING